MSMDDAPPKSSDDDPSVDSDDESQSLNYRKEAKLFYERLEQTGKLIDVVPGTDLASLPPDITHVRYPDGTITRVGFSGTPQKHS